jgi:hypothetical protein
VAQWRRCCPHCWKSTIGRIPPQLHHLSDDEPANSCLLRLTFAAALVEGWRGEVCHVGLTDDAGRFALQDHRPFVPQLTGSRQPARGHLDLIAPRASTSPTAASICDAAQSSFVSDPCSSPDAAAKRWPTPRGRPPRCPTATAVRSASMPANAPTAAAPACPCADRSIAPRQKPITRSAVFAPPVANLSEVPSPPGDYRMAAPPKASCRRTRHDTSSAARRETTNSGRSLPAPGSAGGAVPARRYQR